MNVELEGAPRTDSDGEGRVRSSRRIGLTPGRPGLMSGLLRLLIGVLMCASAVPLFPVAVVGWLMQFMRRTTRLTWLVQQVPADGDDIRRLKSIDPFDLMLLRQWPNWFMRSPVLLEETALDSDSSLKGRPRRWAERLLGAFATNLRLGLQGLANTWVVTLPAGCLWAFSWHAGWNNSFHKGYEQAAIGPLTGLLGVFWFIAVMLYLPMAQARQASSGDWRRFFDFSVIRRIVRAQWFSCLSLGILTTIAGVPLAIMTILPGFFESAIPELAESSAQDLLAFTRRYYFVVALAGFPMLVLLRRKAARIYARGVLAIQQQSAPGEIVLTPAEKHFLFDAGVELDAQGIPATGRLKRLVVLPVRGLAAIAAIAVWFAFVSQIYIMQFLYYRPLTGWLNHPFIQVPKFFYLPPGFRELLD